MEITVEHPTKDAEAHYIREITVKVNKKNRLLHKIVWQQNEQSQKAVYLFADVKPGDLFEITAKCNVFGKKSVIYKVNDGS